MPGLDIGTKEQACLGQIMHYLCYYVLLCGIKNGFYVYRIVRVGSSLPKRSIFHFKIFSAITWIINPYNFDIPRLVYMPFSAQCLGNPVNI